MIISITTPFLSVDMIGSLEVKSLYDMDLIYLKNTKHHIHIKNWSKLKVTSVRN